LSPNQPRTPITAFRLPPNLKTASTSKASSEGRTLTSVVIERLEEYVKEE
jgi:predicted DNA-binding protein